MSVEPPMVVLRHRVYSSREQARQVVAERSDVSPSGAVYIRCDAATKSPEPTGPLKRFMEERGVQLRGEGDPGVEIITPGFADELLKAWPHAQLVGADPEIQATWNVAAQRKDRRA